MPYPFSAEPSRVLPLLRRAAVLAVCLVGSVSAIRLVERRVAAAHLMSEMSWVSVPPFAPSVPSARAALPDSIRARVASLLLSHVGTEYVARLHYVDGSRSGNREPSATPPAAGSIVFRDAWVPFRYSLRFELIDPALGSVSYMANVVVDPNGDLMAPVALPPVRALRDRARMVPIAVARDSAAARGFRAPWALLQYGEQDRAFHYVLSDASGGTSRAVIIDAHTGRVVRVQAGSLFICTFAEPTAPRPDA